AQSGHDPRAFFHTCDRGEALLRAGSKEGVWMRPAADVYAVPRILLDRHARAMDGSELSGEMAGKAQREFLDLADRHFLREREHGVLLRVGGNDLAVVARRVTGVELARERDAHVDVFDRMGLAVPGHANQVRLRLAVLVVAQDDRHR